MGVNLIIPFMMDTQVIYTFSLDNRQYIAKGIIACVYQCQFMRVLFSCYLGV